MLARLMFAWVDFAARKGLREDSRDGSDDDSGDAGDGHEANSPRKKLEARRTGIRGETYAYWYLRRHGYTMIARNYTFPGMKGEIDMAGYDSGTLAFIEVKTRALPNAENSPKVAAQPAGEWAVDHEKRRNLSRMAKQFVRTRRLDESSYRFDILAIDARPGVRPEIRLHKGAFGRP